MGIFSTEKCPNCGAKFSAHFNEIGGSTVCPKCKTVVKGPPLETMPAVVAIETSKAAASSGVTQSAFSKPAAKRYRDAYLVASAVCGIGGIVKGLGIFVAVAIAIAGFIAGSNVQGSLMIPVGGLILAAIAGIPIYVLGLIVAALGNLLLAVLDGAVHTSPFLTDPQKAQVLSLK